MKLTFKNIITALIFQFITIICGFIVPKLIISNYGSSVNGLITSITQFLSYITLLELGIGPVVKTALYKPLVNNDTDTIKKILKTSERIFRRIAYIFIIYIIALCFILPNVVSDEFDIIFTVSLIIIISISSFSEYYFGMSYKILLHADQKPYITNYINIITLIINTILTIVLIKIGSSIQIVKLTSAFIFIARPIAHNMYVKKKYNISLKGVKGDYVIKQKWDAIMQHIAFIIYKNTDIVILTIFSNIKEVSVYGIYMLIVNSIRNVVYAFTGGLDASFGKTIVRGEYDRLNRRFNAYVTFYYTISSIMFIATFFLLIPFVKLYTKGVNDVNYIRPLFGYLMVLAVFLLSIKDPYNDIVKAVAHYKQTQKSAFLEAILNIVLSIILVFNYGLVGVIIGTIVSATIRIAHLIYYSCRHVLKVGMLYFIKKILYIVLEFLIIYLIISLIGTYEINNYVDWVIYAIIVTIICSVVIVSINALTDKSLVKFIKNRGKNVD